MKLLIIIVILILFESCGDVYVVKKEVLEIHVDTLFLNDTTILLDTIYFDPLITIQGSIFYE